MTRSFVDELTPVWSRDTLDEVMYETGTGLDSATREQRTELMSELSDSPEISTKKIQKAVTETLRWDNYRPALALWAGHIEYAEELGDTVYDAPDSVLTSLIERFAQPAVARTELDRQTVVKATQEIVNGSAIASLAIWSDKSESEQVAYIRDIVDAYVEPNPYGDNT